MSKKPTARAIKIQGNKAEKSVSKVLESLGNRYHVFNNVLIKTKGGTTQIDHVVISNYGIFVIETKSYKGMIFGDCNGKNWTQVLYSKSGMQRYQFYSPFLQNYGHLRNLYKLFNLDCKYFLGLIVFTSDSVNLSNVSCPCITHINYLYDIIKSYSTELFSNSEVNILCKRLKENNHQNSYQDRKHVKYVKELQG